MAREFTRIPTSLWTDSEWLTLSMNAQRLLLYIHTQPKLSACGSLPLLPRRWARDSRDRGAPLLLGDLGELVDNAWAWADHEQQEVLIRLLVPPAGHKQLQAALTAAAALESNRLRQVAVARLAAVGHDSHRATSKPDPRFVKMRLAVYARDQYTCQSCRWAPSTPVDYDGRHALGDVVMRGRQYVVRILELDHVYPESLGGAFEFDNLQALCNWCNASKGARV